MGDLNNADVVGACEERLSFEECVILGIIVESGNEYTDNTDNV